jgi:hypothetical protein
MFERDVNHGKAAATVAAPVAVAVLAAGVVVLLAGCQSASYEAVYEFNVTEAVMEENTPEEGPPTDDIAVDIQWRVGSHRLSARITNPADTTAVLVWDGAEFTHDGETVPLVWTAPVVNADLPQAPVSIAARGQLVADMLPVSNAVWEWLPNRAMGGSWAAGTGLFGIDPSAGQTDDERRLSAESAIGQRFKIRLVFTTGDRKLTYIYDMRVTGATVRATYR